MDVDSQPTMEETILVGDDLLMGPPSPVIPQEITSHVLEGVELCDGILRTLFLFCRLMISSLSVKMSWHYIDNVLKRGQSSSLLKWNMQMHDWNVIQLMNVLIYWLLKSLVWKRR
ncbi:hypothetical protein ES332_D03G108800v1 [Gossypium tomentosum]|nr:hypothetical protein ES332_D03G108800v1 [Gossypium tomentosum]TYH80078.1 hypothetical protein ES332_D03G108800v1 [Gossypium tomentosum]TYH80080.1 hypothetical protein ES332_D03G108800v1 [Gossypium tomentosum]TYH80081.1 hypothetical protein ES332_D03G108800v1 [Gossypium tomentosum]TYH80085.1 hypothetical protein ES332_D03G108800v1 [Gossypium tomentosum]